jgi:hypothetical protein
VIAIITVCATVIVLYAGDYGVLRYRIAHRGPESVLSTVNIFYAAQSKAAK